MMIASPPMLMVVGVDVKIVLGASDTSGGDGGGAGGGVGGSGDGGGGDGKGHAGGGGDGGGGGIDGGGGDGSGGIGMPGWKACTKTPGTTEKWASCDGFAIVAWHILYMPAKGIQTPTALDCTTPPNWIACTAPLQELSPANKKTIVSPLATESPMIVRVVSVVAKTLEGENERSGGSGGAPGGTDGGSGEGGGSAGGGGEGKGRVGGGGSGKGGGGDGSGG